MPHRCNIQWGRYTTIATLECDRQIYVQYSSRSLRNSKPIQGAFCKRRVRIEQRVRNGNEQVRRGKGKVKKLIT